MIHVNRSTLGNFVRQAGVYLITCKSNNKVYIGSSINLGGRLRDHIYRLASSTHKNLHLQRAWNKYGEDNFTISVLEVCEKEIAIKKEQFYLDTILKANEYIEGSNSYFLDNSFNITPIAEAPRNVTRSSDFKLKVSNGNKERWRERKQKGWEETREKMSKAAFNRKNTWGKKVLVYNTLTNQSEVFNKICDAADAYSIPRKNLVANLLRGNSNRSLPHLQFSYYEN